MLTFNRLTLENKELFDSYFKKITVKSYEYLFSSLYLWRDLSETKYAFLDDTLIIKKCEENKNNFYMMPYAYKSNDLSNIITFLKSSEISNSKPLYFFGDIESDFIATLHQYTNYKFTITEDIDDFEYIYLTKDLINLIGTKYHSKRNHINNFTKLYTPTVTTISSQPIINDCMNLLDKWHDSKVISCKELQLERPAINDFLQNLDYLGLESIAIYVNDSLIGFSVGERVNDTAVIHIERCDINYTGIYAFINREFLIRNFSETKYVNRQEDCGEEGLRKAKKSYYPDHYIKKYLVKVD